MVPISLLIWIALETAAYLAFGRLFLHLAWPLAIVGAINCLLGLRFWMNATTWFFAMNFASPAPALGFAKRLAIMTGEYFAFLLTFLLVIPFERLWMPADRLPPDHPLMAVAPSKESKVDGLIRTELGVVMMSARPISDSSSMIRPSLSDCASLAA